MLALGTAVVSCSKDEVVIDNTPGVETPVAEGEQEIILQVANTGDGLTTRAGRPLYSSEAKQNIDNVYVVIVGLSEGANKDRIVAVKSFENWNSISTEYNTNGHGRQTTWKLSKDELLEDGDYMVYGIGYSNNSGYESGISTLKGLSVGVEFNKFKATISTVAAEEFFAGEIEKITVENNEIVLTAGSTNNVLTLHRQVTGVMGYYINIPTFALGKQADILNSLEDATNGETNKTLYNTTVKNLTLRLVASACNNTVVGAAFNTGFTTTGNDVQYIVNGFTDELSAISSNASFEDKTPGYQVYEIEVKNWFPNGDVNYDGYLGDGDANTGTDNWGKPASIGNYEVGFQPGSVFGGEFMIPVAKVAGKRTLQLQLIGQNLKVTDDSGKDKLVVDGAADAILRTWNINLPTGDPQIGDAAVNENFVYVVTKSNPYTPVKVTSNVEDETSYSLVRNHLYSVGEKGTDKWDPDTDEPQDLSKGQELILKVNDNWELIHKMEVE